MLHDLIELLIDEKARRHGWTWQRYVVTPLIASAISLGLACLAFVTAGWWLPLLLGLLP